MCKLLTVYSSWVPLSLHLSEWTIHHWINCIITYINCGFHMRMMRWSVGPHYFAKRSDPWRSFNTSKSLLSTGWLLCFKSLSFYVNCILNATHMLLQFYSLGTGRLCIRLDPNVGQLMTQVQSLDDPIYEWPWKRICTGVFLESGSAGGVMIDHCHLVFYVDWSLICVLNTFSSLMGPIIIDGECVDFVKWCVWLDYEENNLAMYQ